ncbi:MAG: adenylate/guanylate cyclase domain-containing protein [Acidimicrobiia bacterium]
MKLARPNVRFTTSTDGVDIGFWDIGSGPPLLLAQNRSLSHAELEWTVQPDRERGQGLLTVVFTDVVSSTQILDRQGDVDEGRRTFREIEDLISDLCSRHNGHLVKNLGDGSLITFMSTRRAIAFSLDLQDRMVSRPIKMRVGMAAGEPIQEKGDIHGAVVVLASRIADLGDAGEVLVPDSVRQLAVGKEFDFQPRGEIFLKGFEEAQRVWAATRSNQPTSMPQQRVMGSSE